MPKPTAADLAAFAKHTAAFSPITPEELAHIIAHQHSAVVFLAKASCSYCRRFAPKLKAAAEKTGTAVRFADSSDKTAWAAFRAQHGIKTVPALVKILSDDVLAVYNSQLTQAKIEDFLS